MGEIILIAIVALLVVGPERLPGAAKAIGKGIRDLRAQTKDLQQTIEQDTQIGEAVREIRGAMRGDPESLYKRATGEDFIDKDEPPDKSDKHKAIDDEFASDKSDDEAASDKSDSESLGKEEVADDSAAPAIAARPEVDRDLPLIRTPAGSLARDESAALSDSTEKSDSDSEHG